MNAPIQLRLPKVLRWEVGRKVKKYGKRLFEWAYRDLPTYATRPEAECAESEYSKELRGRGWGVWQN